MDQESSLNLINIYGSDYDYFSKVSGNIKEFKLKYDPIGALESFKPVLQKKIFQVNEFSLANYTLMRDRKVDSMMAIPVFLNRAFRHGSLYVNKESDLVHPRDLKNKTVGAKEYTQTAGVWWRGTMIDEYDLHWTDIKWVVSSEQRFDPPGEAAVEMVEGDLEQLVIEGKIDAFLAPTTEDSKKESSDQKLRPLFINTEEIERDYFSRTGIYPLNHAMVIHKQCLSDFPTLPKVLFDAFSSSKKEFYNQNGVYSPWGDKIDYDPIQFGLTNKNSKVIKTLLRYLFEQKFISKTPDLESLFVEGSKDFID
ncbi:MAG: hypothetical protein MK031_09810 [Alphaproteobacteria bacterium]|nr:hypothetical protein [Alphaproteobacteria bacterium]|tara:strand:- start:3681 stop:4607 length:927 start_codon:yes stop_codon:yes gene_type:complete